MVTLTACRSAIHGSTYKLQEYNIWEHLQPVGVQYMLALTSRSTIYGSTYRLQEYNIWEQSAGIQHMVALTIYRLPQELSHLAMKRGTHSLYRPLHLVIV